MRTQTKTFLLGITVGLCVTPLSYLHFVRVDARSETNPVVDLEASALCPQTLAEADRNACVERRAVEQRDPASCNQLGPAAAMQCRGLVLRGVKPVAKNPCAEAAPGQPIAAKYTDPCVTNEYIFNPNICDRIAEGTRDACWSFSARRSADAARCSHVRDQSAREGCIVGLATKLPPPASVELCASLPDPTRTSCFALLDFEGCEHLTSAEQRGCFRRGYSIDACKAVANGSARDACVWDMALAETRPDWCFRVVDSEARRTCIASISARPLPPFL